MIVLPGSVGLTSCCSGSPSPPEGLELSVDSGLSPSPSPSPALLELESSSEPSLESFDSSESAVPSPSLPSSDVSSSVDLPSAP